MKTTVLGLVAASFLAAPVMAADETLIYRGNLTLITPTSDSTIEGSKVEADSAVGLDASFEYKFSKSWGIESAVLFASHDVDVDGVTIGDITQVPVLFSANYHFSTTGKADFYVGPTLGMTFWGDLDVDGFGKVKTDSELTYGVSGGADIPLKGNWAFTAGARYLFSKTNPEGVGDVDVNPLTLRAGVAYRF